MREELVGWKKKGGLRIRKGKRGTITNAGEKDWRNKAIRTEER